MVAWLNHVGTLIRVALEHLRMATPLETMTFDVLSDAGLLKTKDMAGSRYVDLGTIPTPAEERHASHMQTDEPPPEPPVFSHHLLHKECLIRHQVPNDQ